MFGTSTLMLKNYFRPDASVLDAASNGASQGICLILNIAANLIAFVAFTAFLDGLMKWATHLLGYEGVGIEFIFGKIFIPVSWALGIDWEDCGLIGNVIGTKTVINEFVAFRLLGNYKASGEISVSIKSFQLNSQNNCSILASIISNRDLRYL